MTNVHGHRPDPISNVDLVEVHEELVQIAVLGEVDNLFVNHG